MPIVETEVDVYCDCGEPLCSQTVTNTVRGRQSLVVSPCKKCLERENDAGYDKGYDAGVNDDGGRSL